MSAATFPCHVEALRLPCGCLLMRSTVNAARRLPDSHPDKSVVACRCGRRWFMERSRDGFSASEVTKR